MVTDRPTDRQTDRESFSLRALLLPCRPDAGHTEGMVHLLCQAPPPFLIPCLLHTNNSSRSPLFSFLGIPRPTPSASRAQPPTAQPLTPDHKRCWGGRTEPGLVLARPSRASLPRRAGRPSLNASASSSTSPAACAPRTCTCTRTCNQACAYAHFNTPSRTDAQQHRMCQEDTVGTCLRVPTQRNRRGSYIRQFFITDVCSVHINCCIIASFTTHE
jgi:hypothetical protein